MSAPTVSKASSSASGPARPDRAAALAPLAELVAVRAAVAGGATRAELTRDLKSLAAPDSAPAAWRSALDAAIAGLVQAELVAEQRARFRVTPAGEAHVSGAVLAAPVGSKTTWADLRDGALTARALGLDPADRAILKVLAGPDGLRAMIVQRAFGLGGDRPLSLSKLRAALAVRALERAFGNQIKSGLGTGSGLSAKPSRLLAGQLSRTPKDFGSDGRLVAALAAEHLGTANGEADTLRTALLRRHHTHAGESRHTPPTEPRPANVRPPAVPHVANDRGEASQRPLPAARPDLAGFVREVAAAAAVRSEGWPGNRKAFISDVFEEIKSRHPAWALTAIEFKAMLSEAHRAGGLVLASADLKDKRRIQDFEKSAIQYKNTVWYFIRVVEE